MIRRHLPPLNTLRAFEAAARHRSMTAAAEELSVTHGAVSRQIAKLEDHLDVKLFVRQRNALALTESGRIYSESLHALFDQLEQITETCSERHPGRERLRVGVFSTFALRFLIPRLVRLRERFPELAIQVESSSDLIDLNALAVDVVIWSGTGDWPHHVAEHLADEMLIPVASPDLLGGRRLDGPGDLGRFVLLHAKRRPGEWQLWLDAVGAAGVDGSGGMQLENSGLVYQAAFEGVGIALAQPMLVRDDLDRRRLVPVIDRVVPSGRANYLLYHEAKAGQRRIRRFSDWLRWEIDSAVRGQSATSRQCEKESIAAARAEDLSQEA